MKILHIAALSLFVCSTANAATVTSTQQASNSSTKYVTESAIIGHTNASNEEVTTTAYMQFDGAQHDIYTVTKVGNSVFPPTRVDPYTTNGKLGDPVLAVNPWLRRTYLAAIEDPTIEDPTHIYKGILNVWYSDDGGQTQWTHRTAKRSSDEFIDRPSIAVSWYSGTEGEIYIAALAGGRIQVYRNSNNGDYAPNQDQYEEVGSVPRPGSEQSPSIAVDPQTGHVYLFWVDWSTKGVQDYKIKVAKSEDRGATFMMMASLQLSPGTLLTPLPPVYPTNCTVDNDRSCDNVCTGNACIKADSSIAQRYNPWSNTFGVVWHQRDSNNLADKTTDIKFAYYSPYGNYWSTPVTVNRFSGGDQWHPALDFDNSGHYLVTYYDSRDSNSSDFTYRVYATRLDPWGKRIGGDSRVTVKAANAASLLSLHDIDPNIYPSYIHTMGEYHDLWWWNGHWTDSHTFAPDNATDDVYMTTLIRGTRASAPADFTGDGVSDYMIYRNGAWIDNSHNTGVWTGEPSASCIPAPADYDGDGTADFALLCDGAWHFYNMDGSYKKGIWVGNVTGQLPVPADYNGDGKDEVVIYRGGFWLAYDYDSGAATWTVNTGVMSDAVPVPMDYDGDGTADFTVYRLARAWHFYTDYGAYVKGIWIGRADGIPVPGDYNADGKEDIVVFGVDAPRTWHFYNFDTAQYDHGVWTGVGSYNGDPLQPAPTDYDGDGTVDFTVHAGGIWHFWSDDGSYQGGIWCGGVPGDQAISRKQHINP
jgi:hypothetical protein